jgi:hypothetical protein
MGAGKGWAKGLSKDTDSRVARMAEAHRGMLYERRTPFEQCKWPFAGKTKLALEWSDEMAYVVGLTATDGCLFTGVRKINFKSEDRQLVATYLTLLGRTNRIKEQLTRTGNIAYVAEFHDSRLYEWFRSVGLMPRKSLILGEIDVPDATLMALARGLLDGDGSIINEVYRADTHRRSDYYWEYLITRFTSASRPHLDWLEARIRALTGLYGSVGEVKRKAPDPTRHPFFRLEYGKLASHVLLPLLYPSREMPCLERKRAIWYAYAQRHGVQGALK